MPRQARLDVSGTLHHVIIRGIEKRQIVKPSSRLPSASGYLFLLKSRLILTVEKSRKVPIVGRMDAFISSQSPNRYVLTMDTR